MTYYTLRPGFGTVTITDTDKFGTLAFEDAGGGTGPVFKNALMYDADLPLAA
jgi:hypothetical protein